MTLGERLRTADTDERGHDHDSNDPAVTDAVSRKEVAFLQILQGDFLTVMVRSQLCQHIPLYLCDNLLNII